MAKAKKTTKATPQATFTPGPWKSEYEGEGQYFVAADVEDGGKWKSVAVVWMNGPGTNNRLGGSAAVTADEAEANARLIAAAPELLAAAKAALDFLDSVNGGGTPTAMALHDAIRKAEGS